MNEWLATLKNWYEPRPLRERIIILVLSWVALYAIFYFLFFSSLESETTALQINIKSLDDQINSWNTQISALNQISSSPLYKNWLQQHELFANLQKKYKDLLETSPTKQWQDIIKTILQSQPNITLVQIKDFPEVAYNPAKLPISSSTLYEQQLLVIVISNYFDTINYIQHLESTLPNIHWDTLHYQVVQYPVAKIEMEFSIFYDKANT